MKKLLELVGSEVLTAVVMRSSSLLGYKPAQSVERQQMFWKNLIK
jgi:hypothetical protein